MESYYPDEELVKDMYAYFGRTIFFIQCLERQLSILLVANAKDSCRELKPSEFDNLLDTNFQKTLGVLLKSLKENFDISDELSSSLEEALKKRNWLVHHYFWERSINTLSNKGLEKMKDELSELSSYFKLLDEEATRMTMVIANEFGISEEDVEELLKMYKDLHK